MIRTMYKIHDKLFVNISPNVNNHILKFKNKCHFTDNSVRPDTGHLFLLTGLNVFKPSRGM